MEENSGFLTSEVEDYTRDLTPDKSSGLERYAPLPMQGGLVHGS